MDYSLVTLRGQDKDTSESAGIAVPLLTKIR